MVKRRKIRYDRVLIVIGVFIFIVCSIFMILKQDNRLVSFDKRAVWISYLNMDILKDKEESQFKENFTIMCDQAISNNLNTLIVQVRAFQDAIYKSDKFPVSTVISSEQIMDYDALEIMVNIAHSKGLKIEAWINPYRISYNKQQWNYFLEYSSIRNYANTDHIIKSGDIAILNPASNKVRAYVVDGIKEIVMNYNVDGIHMDDYFYNESMLENTSVETRKENVNLLVKDIYSAIKNINSNIAFGISPQGNIENARNIGADIDTWLKEEGYVDYVMPQIYWSDQWGSDGTIEMFSARLEAWSALDKTAKVDLYAGLASYNAGSQINNDLGWERNNDNLKQQVEKLLNYKWNGYSLFDYNSLTQEHTQNELRNLKNIIKESE